MSSYEEIIKSYKEECERIAEECEAEGYPSNGSNYDLRCENLWNSYVLQFPELVSNEE